MRHASAVSVNLNSTKRHLVLGSHRAKPTRVVTSFPSLECFPLKPTLHAARYLYLRLDNNIIYIYSVIDSYNLDKLWACRHGT